MREYTDQEICQIIQDYDRIIQELRYGVEAFVSELVSLDSNDDWLCSLLAPVLWEMYPVNIFSLVKREAIRAAQQGKYGLVELKTRYKDIQLPEIQVVDVKDLRHRKNLSSNLRVSSTISRVRETSSLVQFSSL